MSSSTSNNLSASGDDCALGPDRSRSISWTGRVRSTRLYDFLYELMSESFEVFRCLCDLPVFFSQRVIV